MVSAFVGFTNALDFSLRVIHLALEKDIIFKAEGILKAARKYLGLENDLISTTTTTSFICMTVNLLQYCKSVNLCSNNKNNNNSNDEGKVKHVEHNVNSQHRSVTVDI